MSPGYPCCCGGGGGTTNCDGCCNGMTTGDIVVAVPTLSWRELRTSPDVPCDYCSSVGGQNYILSLITSPTAMCSRQWRYEETDVCIVTEGGQTHTFDFDVWILWDCNPEVSISDWVRWDLYVELRDQAAPNTNYTVAHWGASYDVSGNDCWSGASGGIVTLPFIEDDSNGSWWPCGVTYPGTPGSATAQENVP